MKVALDHKGMDGAGPSFHLLEHRIKHFGLAGGASMVTVTASDPSKGSVRVNTIDASSSPWSGTYFRAYPPTLTAVPLDGARFVRWTGAVESTEPVIELPLGSSPVSVTAEFE